MKSIITAFTILYLTLTAQAAIRDNSMTTNTEPVIRSMIGSYNYTNIVVVDAGHGSDSKPLKFGYATIGAAQTNAHVGDTILVRSGSYANAITNGAFNWYLENGASVTIGQNIYGSALNIYGYGDITPAIDDALVPQSLTSWHIECRTFYATIGGSVFVNGYIKADSVGPFNIVVDTTNTWEIHANTINFGNLISFSGDYHPLVKFYCNELQYDNFGELSVQTNSVFSAIIFTNIQTFSVGFSFAPVVWDVGYTKLNAGDITFAPGTRFVGDPMFDNVTTAVGNKGVFQVVP